MKASDEPHQSSALSSIFSWSRLQYPRKHSLSFDATLMLLGLVQAGGAMPGGGQGQSTRAPDRRIFPKPSAPQARRLSPRPQPPHCSLVSTLLWEPLVSTLVATTIVELHRRAKTRADGVVSSLSDNWLRLKLVPLSLPGCSPPTRVSITTVGNIVCI